MARSRTLRLDITEKVYDNLEAHAAVEDAGLHQIARRVIIQWSDEHPAELPDPDPEGV